MSFTSLSFIVFLSACLPSIRELNAIWCVRAVARSRYSRAGVDDFFHVHTSTHVDGGAYDARTPVAS